MFLSRSRILIAGLLAALLASPLAAATSSSRTATKKSSTGKVAAKKSSKGKKSARKKGSWRSRGQQGIDAARAREIQEKLIDAGYLQGQADGVWSERTKNAMRKFQEDNGWQTKILPDSRALIKLGLGPNHVNAINLSSLDGVQTGSND